MRLVAATIRTTANNFLTIEFDARLAPYCEPTYPPRAIVIKNIPSKDKSKSRLPETPVPTRPEIEFTTINNAAVAAAVLTLAHP